MEKKAIATQKHIRISPTKMNIVMKEIRGKSVEEALKIIRFTNRKACRFLEKLVNSAVANAVNNHDMDADRLYIAEVFANPGPIMKRIQPAPMGRAFRINKRTCHNTVILKEREAKKVAELKPEKEEKKATAKKATPKKKAAAKTTAKKTATKTATKKTETKAKAAEKEEN